MQFVNPAWEIKATVDGGITFYMGLPASRYAMCFHLRAPSCIMTATNPNKNASDPQQRRENYWFVHILA